MNGYQMLKDLIDQIQELIKKQVVSDDEEFVLWKTKVKRFIDKKYGSNSQEAKDFSQTVFHPLVAGLADYKSASIGACRKGLEKTRAVLNVYLEEIENDNNINRSAVRKVAQSFASISSGKETKNKKYQVFVSSTYKDLIMERQGAIQVLLDNNCIPVGMEQFPASNMSQMDYIKKMLDDCDYYILILGGRYGSIDGDGVGFTEKEYDYALSIGIPVLTFVVEDIGKLPYDKVEGINIDKYSAFRKKVTKNKLVSFYNSPEDLKSKIVTSIIHCINEYPAVGWVRGNALVQVDEGNSSDASNYTLSNIQQTENQYINQQLKGSFTFDYSNNDGEYVIGTGENTFTTKWSAASNCAIHAYKDAKDIEAIARIKNATELPKLLTGTFDFSSRVRDARIGDAIIWKNRNGKYAATRVMSIKCESHGDDHDELSCEYVIYN